MTITVTDHAETGVIRLAGRFFGTLSGHELLGAMEELRSRGRHYVVVDLARVDLMDSTALGTLIAGLTSMRRDGGDIRLSGMQARIRHLFVMTRLIDNVFRDYPTVEEAEQSFVRVPPFLVEA